jgi:hypothetical protein
VNNQGLVRALNALRPYLGHIVICGAWAWYVYRHYLGRPLEHTAVFTRDLDCVTPTRLPVMEGVGLLESLETADFVWVPKGSDNPPAAVFVWPRPRAAEVEVEFLAPARGSGTSRVVSIQPNITAQALRDLDILLEDPMVVELDERSVEAGGSSFQGAVRVPRLAHFSIQKALIFPRRQAEDQAKDLAYVFDLIDSTNKLADQLLGDVVRAHASGHDKEVQRFREVAGRQFASPAFVKKVVEQIPPERRPLSAYAEREVAGWLARLATALGD